MYTVFTRPREYKILDRFSVENYYVFLRIKLVNYFNEPINLCRFLDIGKDSI